MILGTGSAQHRQDGKISCCRKSLPTISHQSPQMSKSACAPERRRRQDGSTFIFTFGFLVCDFNRNLTLSCSREEFRSLDKEAPMARIFNCVSISGTDPFRAIFKFHCRNKRHWMTLCHTDSLVKLCHRTVNSRASARTIHPALVRGVTSVGFVLVFTV